MSLFRIDENSDFLRDEDILANHRKLPPLLTDAVLVSRDDMDEKIQILSDVQSRYEQLKNEMEFSLHRKDNEYLERMRSLKDEFNGALALERDRYMNHKNVHHDHESNHDKNILYRHILSG